MIVYIKKRADFALRRAVNAESWDLPLEAISTESGKVVVSGEMRDCVGDWLCILNKVVLITQAQPDKGRTTLATSDPAKAFDRQLFFPDTPSATYGAFLKDALEREYRDCVDVQFRLPYLRVTSADDTTLSNPDLDDTRLYRLSTIMASARRRGVYIDFALGTTSKPGDTLDVTISKIDSKPRKIVFNDGHAQLAKETYSENGIAKITIMQEIEKEERDEPQMYTLYDFYLDENGDVSSTPPENRAAGRWEYVTCKPDDVPLRRAAALFSDNLASHKIEFDADFRMKLYTNVLLRLNGGLYRTSIVYVGKSNKDERYHYKCGELSVTTTDKIREALNARPTVVSTAATVVMSGGITAAQVNTLIDNKLDSIVEGEY